jgi:O6-methylguanine-DNA--protein-cysteine methyltransferase
VIGSDGGLVGYAAGLDIKAKPLTLENAIAWSYPAINAD